MDIDLLSKMVRELILDNDRVTLPGVGAFVAEIVPASFSDRGYTINPPYRRLTFRQGKSQEADELLVELYASANKIEKEIARKVLEDFLSGMVDELKQRKTLIFTGLGRLRATKENNFFFISDEDLDIFPEGRGLESLSLKSHVKPKSFDFSELNAIMEQPSEEVAPVVVEETPTGEAIVEETPIEEVTLAEVSAGDAPAEYVKEEAAEPALPAAGEEKPQPLEQAENVEMPQPVEKTAPTEKPENAKRQLSKTAKISIITIVSVLLLILILYAVFMLLVEFAPDFIDRLLYTSEELEIINHK